MLQSLPCCDTVLRVDTQHLLHHIVELSIAGTHYVLEGLTVADVPCFGGRESVGVLEETVLQEIGGALLWHHLEWDLATDVFDEAQVLIGVVDWEQKVRRVELEKHASNAPQVRREAPAIL